METVERRFGLLTTDATCIQAVTVTETAALVPLGWFVIGSRRDVLSASREAFGYDAGSGLLTAMALQALFVALARGRFAVVDPFCSTAPLVTVSVALLLLGDVARVTMGVGLGPRVLVFGAG